MKFIAHRGDTRTHPENTLPAFEAVLTHPQNGQAIIGIELDIHLTSDGRIPVMHETSIVDANGQECPVGSMTFNQLQKMHAESDGLNTVPIPDIHETLDMVSHRTELCFEIKEAPYNVDRFTGLLVEALTKYRPKNDVVLSSFSHEILSFVIPRTKDLGLRYGFICRNREQLETLPKSLVKQLQYVHPHYGLAIDYPDLFTDPGLQIQCWTVNDLATIEALANLECAQHIRSIMTDDLDLCDSVQAD